MARGGAAVSLALRKKIRDHGSLSAAFRSSIIHVGEAERSNWHGMAMKRMMMMTMRRRSSSSSSRASWMEEVVAEQRVRRPPFPLSSSSLMNTQIRNYCQGKGKKGSEWPSCWSCGGESRGCILVCPSCSAIQSPDPSITYFQIFDQDQKYEMDPKDLEAKYKSLMKKLHPDLSHGKSKEEKGNSAQLSALVTTAYNELLNPVSRATYLLKLRGVQMEEEGTVDDSELILEVMELREALENNPDKDTLERLYKTASNRMIQWSNSFNNAFEEGNTVSAISALQRMSYFGRLCEAIKRELL